MGCISAMIFLGILGGHKFYEEKFKMKFYISYTCGLFGIGIIVDLITILTRCAS